MPRKSTPHREKSLGNVFKEITNPYSNADGLMQNSRADNVLQIAEAKSLNSAKKANWQYGYPQHEKHVKIVRFKDKNGNWQKRKIYVGSTVLCTIRDLDSDETKAAIIDGGEIIEKPEIEARGWNWSGFLQMAKSEFRMLHK